jgi:hypothetical protein
MFVCDCQQLISLLEKKVMGSTSGERQTGKKFKDIAPNHIARYEFATNMLLKHLPNGGTVLDAASGVAYGSKIMAMAGYEVEAWDRAEEAHVYSAHFAHKRVKFRRGDIMEALTKKYDAIVSLETIEHIENDMEWIDGMKSATNLIIGTVPNEAVVPFNPKAYVHHYRHYTREDMEEAFAPWKLADWHTQFGKWTDYEMIPGDHGNALGFVAKSNG